MKKIAILVLIAFLLTGCMQSNEGNNDDTNVNENQTISDSDMFSNRDLDASYDEEDCVFIELQNTTATSSSDAVTISGSTIKITEEATYVISGSLDNGMIIVECDKTEKLKLVLNNVDIHSETSAALYIIQADKVVVTLAEGSTNTLSNGGTFEAIDSNNIDATVFSKADLTFNGNGTLTVDSPGDHGIVGKDDLVFAGGNYIVTSASHAIDANDSVRITNSSFQLTANKDGIHAENNDDETLGFVYIQDGSFVIDAQGDGISANAYMKIVDGDFAITTGGGSVNASKQTSDMWGNQMPGRGGNHNPRNTTTTTTTSSEDSTSIKGIKAQGNLTIQNGTFVMDTADDAIHSNASITVLNGNFDIQTGDDGIHADETLLVENGNINISKSYEGLEALTIELVGGDIAITSSDDGLNAAGGNDSSGTEGFRQNDRFGGMGSGSLNGKITISGGTLTIHASGDGIDANGSLEITGGYTIVSGPVSGDTSVLDYDNSATITGGTFIGTGALTMAQSFTSSTQGVMAVQTGSTLPASTLITLEDNGKTLFSYTTDQSFIFVLISSPELQSNHTYTMHVGDLSADLTAQ